MSYSLCGYSGLPLLSRALAAVSRPVFAIMVSDPKEIGPWREINKSSCRSPLSVLRLEPAALVSKLGHSCATAPDRSECLLHTAVVLRERIYFSIEVDK